MNSFIDFLNACGGISALGAVLGAALWYSLNLRSKKRQEKAAATKAEAEAHATEADGEQSSADWVLAKLHEIEKMQARNTRQIVRIERKYTLLLATVKEIDIYRCNVVDCVNRKPPLGTHHTPLPAEEDSEDADPEPELMGLPGYDKVIIHKGNVDLDREDHETTT